MKKIVMYAFILLIPSTARTVIIQNNLPFSIKVFNDLRFDVSYTISPGQEQKIVGPPIGISGGYMTTQPVWNLLLEMPIKPQITFFQSIATTPKDFTSSDPTAQERIKTVVDKNLLVSSLTGTSLTVVQYLDRSKNASIKNPEFDTALNSYLQEIMNAITAAKSL